MAESRAELKERLKREGRWDEAVQFRERRKAEGATPAQAWRETAEAFPPLPVNGQAPQPPAPAVAAEGSAPARAVPEAPPARRPRRSRKWKRNAGKPPDWEAVAWWVFNHLDPMVGDRGSPYPACLPMLDWARKNADGFIRLFVSKFFLNDLKRAGEGKPREGWGADGWPDDGRPLEDCLAELRVKPEPSKELRELDEMLKKYENQPPNHDTKALPPAAAPAPAPARRPVRLAPEPTPPPEPVVRPKLCPFCERHGAQADCGQCWLIRRDADVAAAALARTRQDYR